MDIEDPQALISYLRERGHIGAEEQPEVRVLAGGVSNRTVWLRRARGDEWVLKQALERLRVSVEWLSPPARISREALGMRWLGRLLPHGSVPEFLFEDPEHFLLAMSAVAEPHRNWKSMLLEGDVVEGHIDQFAAIAAAIHGERSVDAAEAFGDRSYFESLRLEPYYSYTATRVPEAAAFLNALVTETRATRVSLVHGDFSPKNVLVHDGRLVLLDHEVIHFGDPAFDLGFALTHLLSKAHHVVRCREAFTNAARQFWSAYCGADESPRGTSVPLVSFPELSQSGAEAPRGLKSTLHWVPGNANTIRHWVTSPPVGLAHSNFASLSSVPQSRIVRHTLGCLLARVDGRSPLEYLADSERAKQRAVVIGLMAKPPGRVFELIDAFVEGLG